MAKISLTSVFFALPALFLAEAAFADFVCTTSGGDSRTFTARGRTQAEAQNAAFNTCNGAGNTGRRSCQVNMNCFEEGYGHGHGPGHGPGFPPPPPPPAPVPPPPGPGPGPGWGNPYPGHGPGPGWGRPHRPEFYECVTSGGDSRQFFGRGRTQSEAAAEAFNNCNSAGRTGRRSCQRNLSCYLR